MTKSNSTKIEDNHPALIQPASLTMLQKAIETGMEPEKLLQFYEIHEKFERNEARKAYVRAMSEFKKTAIVIVKDSTVQYETDKGITSYNHASLFNVVNTITESLARHGLSHRWETSQGEGGRIEVTCIITHELGHSEKTSLVNSPDKSGGKNNIQAVGSTVTYLERYTLLALSGVATKDQDNDAFSVKDVETIELDQQNMLIAELDKTGANKVKFFALFGVSDISELPVSELQKAILVIKAKK